jgi:eukaryotic-like serine/threonine-protein kinase
MAKTKKRADAFVLKQKAITEISQIRELGAVEPIVVNGRWEVRARIGGGGQGETFRVKDRSGRLSGEFVLKLLKSRRPNALKRFAREIEAIKKLKHPGIISIVDHGLPPEATRPFYVMPFMENGDLDAFASGFRDDAARVLACFGQICHAVAAAHAAGIVHRDIKPENILFDEDWNPVIADFGICFDQARHWVSCDGW